VVGVAATFDGVEFTLDLRDNLQRELFYEGAYEAPLHELLVGELRPGDVVADIGANIGVHGLAMARRLAASGGRLLAFEPATDTAEVLRSTAERNGIAVTLVDAALGRSASTGTLHQSTAWEPGDLGVRSLYGEGDAVGEVRIVPFDDWADEVELDRLDIVKIDVEGAELEVLLGMQRSLRRLRPRLVVVELVDELLARSGASGSAVGELLAGVGYATEGPTVEEIVRGPTGALWPNAVFRPT
jgi:FkbM family methyltransferase